jgi:hypothetical protein
MNEPKEPRLFEVTLGKPHTHAGSDYKAGDKIMVDKPTRDWLTANDVLQKEGAK